MSSSSKPDKCEFLKINFLRQMLKQMPKGKQACILGDRNASKHPGYMQLLGCLIKAMKQAKLTGKMKLGGIMSPRTLRKRHLEIGLVIVPDARMYFEAIRVIGDFRTPVIIVDSPAPRYVHMDTDLQVQISEIGELGNPTAMFPLSDLPSTQARLLPAIFADTPGIGRHCVDQLKA